MTRLRLICLFAVLGLLAVAPAAEAGKVLSIRTAAKVTKKVAKRDCNRDRHCEDFNAANCRRQAPRRVSCVASYSGASKEGAYQCDRLVLVRLRADGDLKHAKGKRSCYEI